MTGVLTVRLRVGGPGVGPTAVAALRVSRTTSGAVDGLRAWLPPDVAPTVGSAVELDVGDAAVTARLFTGEVVRTVRGPTGCRVDAHGAARALQGVHEPVDRRDVTVLAVLQDVAAPVGVEVASESVEGPTLPRLRLDPAVDAWRQLCGIAATLGMALVTTASGELRVVDWLGSGRASTPPGQLLSLVGIDVRDGVLGPAVQVIADAPAEARGEQVDWFPGPGGGVAAAAGEGPAEPLERPVARTAELAERVARAEVLRRERTASTATVTVPGNPSVELTATVRASDDVRGLTAEGQILALDHALCVCHGFRTTVTVGKGWGA